MLRVTAFTIYVHLHRSQVIVFVLIIFASALLVREKLFKSTFRAPFVEISKRVEQKVHTYTLQAL